MFDRLKKVFSNEEKTVVMPPSALASAAPAALAATPAGPDLMAEWAAAHGCGYTGFGEGKGFSLTGQTGGKPWKLERGRTSRDYIHGDELRARAELKVNDDAAVLIMNRALKEALEKKAYEMYTDTLQTTADPSLPEEMRWLAMYPEAGWDIPAPGFWERYSVLADQKDHAQAWLTDELAGLLMNWPQPGPDDQVPFMLMLLRGKGYLRMQYTPADLPTLEHAALIYTTSCSAALAGLGADISL